MTTKTRYQIVDGQWVPVVEGLPKYEIVDSQSGFVVGRGRTLRSAYNSSEKRNRTYGAHRYFVRPRSGLTVTVSDNGQTTERVES